MYRPVGGWVRDHGYVQTGGGLGKRPWVSKDKSGGWVRVVKTILHARDPLFGGGGVRQETMGLYRQVGDG